MPNWENLPPVKDTGDNVSASEFNAVVDALQQLDGTLDANGNKIENLPAPTNDNDAARKKYVDDGLAGKAASSHTHSVSQITGLQDAIDGIEGELSTKASSSHTHTISDVTGLQTALDGKAASSHNHSATEITSGTLGWARLPIATTTTVGGVKRNEGTSGQYVSGIDGSGNLLYGTPAGGGGSSDWGDIGGTLSDQTDLQAALDSKQDVQEWSPYLADFDSTSTLPGVHYFGDSTTGTKPDFNYGHTWIAKEDETSGIVQWAISLLSDVAAFRRYTGTWSAWTTVSNVGHTHAISDVTGLQSELDDKLESVDITDITASGTASSNTFLRGDGAWQRPALSGLSGVNVAGVTDGQVLAWNSGVSLWMPATPSGGGGTSELADLDDVTLTTPTNGDSIIYAAGDWVNKPTYIAPAPFSSRPAANTVAPGTRFTATDVSYKSWTSDGTNWHAEFQGHPVVEPPAAVNWTAFGNGSWALTNEGGYLKCKSTMGSTVKRNFFVVPLPVGTGWTIETELLVYHGSGSTPGHAGLAVVNSTDPITDSATFGYRAIAAYHGNQSRQYGVNIFSGTDLTSAASTQQGFMGDLSAMTTTNSHRFRVRRTPTWFIFELTVNGYSWDMNYAWNPSVGVGANPTHIGIYTSHAAASGYELNEINVVNWRQY